MKNLFKLFGIIALVVIIGFSLTACNMDGDDDGNSNNNNNNQQTQAADLTFTLSDGTAADNKFEVTVSGTTWKDDSVSLSNLISCFEEGEYSVGSKNWAYDMDVTLSADKKTVVVTYYDQATTNYVGSHVESIHEDVTFPLSFSNTAGNDLFDLEEEKSMLVCSTLLDYEYGSPAWEEKTGGFQFQYRKTITLVGEPVSSTVKNDVYKPE